MMDIIRILTSKGLFDVSLMLDSSLVLIEYQNHNVVISKKFRLYSHICNRFGYKQLCSSIENRLDSYHVVLSWRKILDSYINNKRVN